MRKLVRLAVPRERLPQHVAIIMDGNGRWAERRGLPRLEGHRRGVEAVRQAVEGCRELEVPALTLFSFSQENWGRPADEVEGLMELLQQYCIKERSELRDNDIRLIASGDLAPIPSRVRHALEETVALTAKHRSMTLNLALSYSGRADILSAVRRVLDEIEAGKLRREDLDEARFARYLATGGLPDPDLLIRTSGEMRISNFMLWQLAYTEIYVTKVLWPDFRKRHLREALRAFARRQRRFGLTGAQLRAQGVA